MIIYKTTNLINGKIYVGKHFLKEENDEYLGSGHLLKRAVKKYGKENFIRETLEICDTKEQLNEREIFWIDKLKSRNLLFGYNMSKGGDGGDLLSDHPDRDNIIKIRNERSRTIGTPKSIETKKKNGTFYRFGKDNPNFGNVWDEEQKKNASLLWKERYELGYVHPQKGVALPEDQKLKISESRKGKYTGESNSFFDKQHTSETKEILSRKGRERGYRGSQQKKCMIGGVIYNSLSDASKILNIPAPTILWRIKSKNQKFNSYAYFQVAV